MPKKAEVSVHAEANMDVGFGGGLKKHKRGKSKDKSSSLVADHVADMDRELQVTIPTTNGSGKQAEAFTPTSTVSSGFGTLVHSMKDTMLHTTVTIPTLQGNKLAGFDVCASPDDGTLLVHKLGESKVSTDGETFLRDGHRIVGVHIPVTAMKFDEAVQLLNSMLEYNPQLHVKRESDSLGDSHSTDEVRHIGPEWPVNGTLTKKNEESEGDAAKLDGAIELPDEVDPKPIGLLQPAETQLVPAAVNAFDNSSIEPDGDFVEPSFEHENLPAVGNALQMQHERLCQWSAPDASIAEKEADELEELSQRKHNVVLMQRRDSDMVAKLSIRSKESLRNLHKLPTKSNKIIFQKRAEPLRFESEAEVTVLTTRVADSVSQDAVRLEASNIVAIQQPRIPEVSETRRSRHKWRPFKKTSSMKRGMSTPELPIDANDSHDVCGPVELSGAARLRKADTASSSASGTATPTSKNSSKAGKRDKSLPPFIPHAETEIVGPMRKGKNRETTYSKDDKVEPSNKIILNVVPITKVKESDVIAQTQPVSSFEPRCSTLTEKVSGENSSILRRSFLERLSAKLKRSSSREPVKLTSVKRIDEPAEKPQPIAAVKVQVQEPEPEQPEEPSVPVVVVPPAVVPVEIELSHEHLSAFVPALNPVLEDEHLYALYELPAETIDRNNNAPELVDEVEPECVDEDRIEPKPATAVHAAPQKYEDVESNNDQEEPLVEDDEPKHKLEEPELELEEEVPIPPLPSTQPPDRLQREHSTEHPTEACVTCDLQHPQLESSVVSVHESPETNAADSVVPPEVHLLPRKLSVASSIIDDDRPPRFEPDFTRKNTILRHQKRPAAVQRSADVGVDCDLLADDADADRISITESLVDYLLDSDTE